ncbi:Ku protein [Streptomyces sp. NBC_01353]|uniref:Ku protein n=1 Tax=Streptomyces sp. NBC_01353 TaxID=2903835 RepID=UPI002E34E594|nr:Ku protein [Streptomyces sp. NBC_01353]
MAKFALRGRERLGLLRPYGDALLLHSMRWDDEVRDPNELTPDDVDLTEKEIGVALALLEAMSVEHLADIGESELTDHYREAPGAHPRIAACSALVAGQRCHTRCSPRSSSRRPSAASASSSMTIPARRTASAPLRTPGHRPRCSRWPRRAGTPRPATAAPGGRRKASRPVDAPPSRPTPRGRRAR